MTDYCNYYKNLLIEELVLIKDPANLHYGKCCLVGRVFREEDEFFVENISLKCLPKEFQLPEGYVKMRLLLESFGKLIPVNKPCEIFGEPILLESNSTGKVAVTSFELKQRLRQMQILAKENHTIKTIKTYSPAFMVHSLNIVDQPSELIEKNLQIRLLNLP